MPFSSTDSAPAITVRQLGKCYRIYDRPQDRLKQALRLGGRQYFREFWALRGVDLDIRRGETVGIVGRNGSGKSTLLQMICGILAPTTGTVDIRGRVAALLELGAGFNPEFTGRENVFMNGAILGLSQAEVARRYDEIVAFSELAEFIDRPVKTYSSGMFVRLAFAVATSCDPDILVVDEALAVGDEAFQRKCYARLERMREQGATILFVSHSAGTVLQLCESACLLDQGELLLSGSPRSVITAYQRLINASPKQAGRIRQEIVQGIANSSTNAATPSPSPMVQAAANELRPGFDPHLQSKSCTEYEPRGARISRPRITTLDGEQVNLLVPREEYILRYSVEFFQPTLRARFGTMIKGISGSELGGTATQGHQCEYVSAGERVEVCMRFRCLLPPSVYFMNVGVRGTLEQDEVVLHRLVDVLAFRVISDGSEQVQGMFDFLFTPTVECRQGVCQEAA